jgi:hypothetical protein
MAGRQKHSKKPLYAQAFRLFCEHGLSPGEIAQKLALPIDALTDTIVRQRWAERKATLAGQHAVAAAETRLQAQVAVDSTLVRATQSAAETLANAYVQLITEAAALPTHPLANADGSTVDPQEAYRATRAMLDAKADTMRKATEGLRELIATAQNVGLLKVDRGGKPPEGDGRDDKPIDLSKLTQLRIAIVQANGQVTKAGASLMQDAQVTEVQAVPAA